MTRHCFLLPVHLAHEFCPSSETKNICKLVVAIITEHPTKSFCTRDIHLNRPLCETAEQGCEGKRTFVLYGAVMVCADEKNACHENLCYRLQILRRLRIFKECKLPSNNGNQGGR